MSGMFSAETVTPAEAMSVLILSAPIGPNLEHYDLLSDGVLVGARARHLAWCCQVRENPFASGAGPSAHPKRRRRTVLDHGLASSDTSWTGKRPSGLPRPIVRYPRRYPSRHAP